MLQLLRWWNEHITFPLRFKYLTQRLAPYLDGSRRILDFGSSDGRSARQLLVQHPSAEIVRLEKFRFNFLDPCKHVIFFLRMNKI